MMPLRAVLFDLDDTLHDKSATQHLVAADQFDRFALNTHGIDPSAWIVAFDAVHDMRIEKSAAYAELGRRFGLDPSIQSEMLAHFDETLGARAVALPGAKKAAYRKAWRAPNQIA